MEKQSYLSKSRYLLLFLFALIVGSGTAWGDPVTETFDGWGTTLPTNWSLLNNATYGNSNGYTYIVNGDYKRGNSGKSLYSDQSSNTSTYYIVTPKLAANSTFSFYFRKKGTSGSTKGYIYIYTYNESTGAVGTSSLWTCRPNTTYEATSNYQASGSISVGSSATKLAILIANAVIDDFTYTEYVTISGPGFAVKDGSTTLSSPYAYNFGLATAGTEKEFTLSNPGTEATPIAVDVTGANGFTAAVEGNATSIPAGGQKTLTITMPDATASGSIVVTPKGAGLSAFTFNVSGTVRDPNKVYLDFSDGKIPEGWTSVQIGSYGSAWSASTGYISQSGSSSSDAWAFTSPKMNFTNGEIIFFETAKYSSFTWYNPSVTVEYTTDATGATGWTAIGSAFTDDTYGTWTKRSVTIPVDGVKRIRFNGWYVHLRNIYGGEEIARPKSVTATGISATGATIGWTAFKNETAWQVSYSTTSGSPASGTLISADATSKVISGLTPLTKYYVSVRIDNGGGNYGEWSDEINFTTKVAPISSFPYTENFNSLSSGQIPTYWDNSEGTTDTDSYKWVYYATGHEGAGLRFDSYYNGSNKTNFLKTRPFSFTEGQPMRLTFWYKNPAAGDFSIYASTDGGATYPTALVTGLTAQSDWTEKVIDIPAAVYGDNVVIVFKGTSNYGSGDAYIYLDDVSISEKSNYAMSITGSDVSENTIAFGTVKNTTSTKKFTIKNDGGSALTHVSVVSSDAEVFTVSDTDFEIAKDGTKEITVTFVKGVEKDGGYSETITVSQANIATPIELTVTGTYVAPTPATIAISEGATAVGATVAFGTVGKAKSKTFTVTNSGETTLTITNIESNNTTDFTVSPSTLNVDGGQTGEFIINFLWDGDVLNAEKSATITLTSNAATSPTTFTVTGTRADMWTEDFSSAGIPDGWEDAASAWTFAGNGEAVGSYNNGKYLYTPSLAVEAGQSMTFEAKKTGGFVDLIVYYSKDNGDYTQYTGLADLTTEYQTYTISGLAAGNYRFRINDEAVYLKNFEGFKLNANDPTLAVYSDAEATQAVATATTKDFGWAQSSQSATYYIKNGGTGTLTISDIDVPAGFTAATAGDVMTVAAGADPLALTVTMTAGEIGAKSGTITLTTDGGNFTIPVKGFIYGSKNLVDFTNASQYTGWTGVNVTDDVAALSSTAIQTTSLKATANEPLYVEIKGSSSYSSKSFSYSYSSDNGVNWSDAKALVESTYGNVADQVFTINDIAATDAVRTVLIRFTGSGLGINRIYGFEAVPTPVMALDKTADYNFGMQTAAAEYVITVTNNGTGDLENLAAVLTTGEDYTAVVGKTTVEPGDYTTITVTQKASTEYASHSDVLTISADGVNDVVINLSGKTRDASKSFADFEADGMPVGWTYSGWSRTGNSSNHYAQSDDSNISSLLTPALTIAAGEEIKYDAWVGYTGGTFKVRYTTNGGINWTESDVEATTTQTTKTLSLNNAEPVIAYIQFVGDKNARIDNFYGGTVADNAPLILVMKSSDVVENGATEAFGDIQAQATAQYTITNVGTGKLTITSPITTITGVATAEVSETSLNSGSTTFLTITMPVEAPYGEKSGAVTVETNLGNFVINYTATTMNPNALNVDFSDAQLPAGWYNDGWNVDYSEKNIQRSNRTSDTYFMTQKLSVAGTSDVLKFDAKKYGSQYVSSTVLKVSYSTDRVNWTEIDSYASEMTTSYKTFEISGLAAGEYYLKFEGRYASIDNIIGWTKVTGIEHDLYVTASTLPSGTKEADSEFTASATVTSLRAAEKDVYAKLFINGTAVATSATQDIALNGSQTFSINYTPNADLKSYTAQIKVFFGNNSEAFSTKKVYTLNETVNPTTITAGTFDVTLTRTFSVGWNTVCLPFAIADIEEFFGDGAKAYNFSGYNSETKVLSFSTVDALVTSTPYLVYVPTEKNYSAATLSNVTLSDAAAGSVAQSPITLVGTYAPIAAGSLTGNYGVTSDGEIRKAGSGASLNGFRAYFTDVPASARIFIDGEATGIGRITADGELQIENVYNLNGQKVQNAQKGLYIVNGKKVVIK